MTAHHYTPDPSILIITGPQFRKQTRAEQVAQYDAQLRFIMEAIANTPTTPTKPTDVIEIRVLLTRKLFTAVHDVLNRNGWEVHEGEPNPAGHRGDGTWPIMLRPSIVRGPSTRTQPVDTVESPPAGWAPPPDWIRTRDEARARLVAATEGEE